MNQNFVCAVLVSISGLLTTLVWADSPGIHTDRSSGKILPLPKGDDVFHFVIFGDRTGGPPEGIKVLAQAVEDTNLLDPDLVMTVGDLVNGYNQTDVWLQQMEEYRSTMSKLKMPWFPVAGNHDIYWRRSPIHPEPKPPREHEENYEKHFGPLWYWFEHKHTGFLVLFSDEGLTDGRAKDFSDRAQQRMSQKQMDWIAAELEKMKHLKHIFVFLHHPYWWGERYPASNWDEVHKLLVKNGNVRAVIAGHIHQMRYDGERDGIGYYALATTGASLTPGLNYRYFGLLHHFNVVTVRDSGYSMASIPVGAVFDPKQFTPARWADIEAARYTLHEFISPPIALNFEGSASTTYQVVVTNTCTLSIDVSLLGKGDKSWVLAPDHRHATVAPGQRRLFDFVCLREPSANLEGLEPPEFELRFDVLTPEARLAMPSWSRRARTRLEPPAQGWPEVRTNGYLRLDGKTACLEIDREYLQEPAGPFTIEAWIKPADDDDGAIVSNLRIGGFNLEIGGTPKFSVQTTDLIGDPRKVAAIDPPITAKAKSKLAAGRWSHLAGVFDGAEATLFINGQKASSIPAAGGRIASDKSLYIGARPNGAWNVHNFSTPVGFWKGSVDDVRLSRGARYQSSFTPEPKLVQDASTIFAISNDQNFGPFVPVAAPVPMQAMVKGQAKLLSGDR